MSAPKITIEPAKGPWVVRAQGAVIGESASVLLLTEGSYDPVAYFPRDDISMAFLEPSDHRTTCPWKGEATYFDIHGKSAVVENAAWSYEAPIGDVAAIKGYLAFYPDKVQAEPVS